MSEEQKAKENEVFGQELKIEDLAAAAGGADENLDNCIVNLERDIYGGNGFPNCAQSVEDDSWCFDNDACLMGPVDYQNLKNCTVSWK